MANQQETKTATDFYTVENVDSEQVAQFIAMVQATAAKKKITPSQLLLLPDGRQETGLSVLPEVDSRLAGRRVSEEEISVARQGALFSFVDNGVKPYEVASTKGEEAKQVRERVWTGWDIEPHGEVETPVSIPEGWEIGLEPIHVRLPQVTADRLQQPSVQSGSRTLSKVAVAKFTGLSETQFDIQAVPGGNTLTIGVLEATPVILPTMSTLLKYGTAWSSNSVNDTLPVRDPMLLRINPDKLKKRLGSTGDLVGDFVTQVNGYSGLAVKYAVQAMTEAHMGEYLRRKLDGAQSSELEEWMIERVRMLRSAASLAMTSLETLISQSIAFSSMGICILTPKEMGFAGQVIESFFAGVSEEGEFLGGGSGQLNRVIDSLNKDLHNYTWGRLQGRR